MDGLELLDRIHAEWPEIPTLLMTGHGETDLAIRALRGGAYDLIQKPIDRDYLVAAVRRATETRVLRREVRAKQEALEVHAADLEKKVQERTEELSRALAAKDEFLALVSHELRTPTTTIYGSSRLLNSNRKLDDEARAELLAGIETESRRLHQLIENLLVAGGTNLGQNARVENTDVAAIIDAAIASRATPDASRPIKAAVDASARFARADPTFLRQVVDNLLSNASKYAPNDTEIEVLASATDDEVRVSIVDRGPGVAEHELEKIFESFYRAERSDRRVPGKGLGLAVCKKLVEAQGGRTWAENRSSGGLCVTFTLPAIGTASSRAAAREGAPA
jgi:K+-sensing histidine kinase KdpD